MPTATSILDPHVPAHDLARSIDRIILRAYHPLCGSPGGFRFWWRQLMGGEDELDDAHLMRLAGRFARRVRGWAKRSGVPVIDCARGELVVNTVVLQPGAPRTPSRAIRVEELAEVVGASKVRWRRNPRKSGSRPLHIKTKSLGAYRTRQLRQRPRGPSCPRGRGPYATESVAASTGGVS